MLLCIGGMKFMFWEAGETKPLALNSSLMDWGYGVVSLSQFAVPLLDSDRTTAASNEVPPIGSGCKEPPSVPRPTRGSRSPQRAV